MVIDKIDKFPKIQKTQVVNFSKNNSNLNSANLDSVSISKEALKAQEQRKISDQIQHTPDVRMSRVEEVKKKLSQGAYDNIDDEVLDKISDQLVKALLRN